MATKHSDFSANVARYKAIADERLSRLRESVRFDGFLTDEAIEAFSKVEGSAYAGRPLKNRKVTCP